MGAVLGIGIIGCGAVSGSYFENVPRYAALDIRGCADLNRGVAEECGARYGVRSETISNLLRDPEIDLIVNLTSADAHFAIGREVLRSGKHLFSEKPLALTFAEAQELRAEAVRQKRGIGIAPDTFLSPAYQMAREALDGGLIGDTRFVTCHVMGRGAEVLHPSPARFYNAGQGPLVHHVPYALSALMFLLGPVHWISAQALTSGARREMVVNGVNHGSASVDCQTTYQALLTFRSGVQATLLVSWDVWAHGLPALEIYGAKGTLRAPDPLGYSGHVLTATADDLGRVERQELRPEGFPKVYRGIGLADMARAVIEGGAYRCSDWMGLHVVEAFEAMDKSVQTGERQELTMQWTRPDVMTADEISSLLR